MFTLLFYDRISTSTRSSWPYFTSDALGSVRQLADAVGQVGLAQSYWL